MPFEEDEEEIESKKKVGLKFSNNIILTDFQLLLTYSKIPLILFTNNNSNSLILHIHSQVLNISSITFILFFHYHYLFQISYHIQISLIHSSLSYAIVKFLNHSYFIHFFYNPYSSSLIL